MQFYKVQNGFLSVRPSSKDVPRKGGGRRGKIKENSKASFRRLRNFLALYSASGEVFGVTLTIGGLETVSDAVFKGYHHRLIVWLNQQAIKCVWRIELQERGMPHIHAIVYGSYAQAFSVCVKWLLIINDSVVTSFDKLPIPMPGLYDCPRFLISGWWHQIDMQRISDNDYALYRYLVSHASKSKKVQLGWHGRQWGVVNKRAFKMSAPVDLGLLDCEVFMLIRWLRRMCRFKGACNSGRRVWFCDPCTVGKMVSYIKLLGEKENE